MTCKRCSGRIFENPHDNERFCVNCGHHEFIDAPPPLVFLKRKDGTNAMTTTGHYVGPRK